MEYISNTRIEGIVSKTFAIAESGYLAGGAISKGLFCQL